MDKRSGRQYRYITPDLRCERAEDGKKTIRGYFSVFGEAYQMFPGFTETIDSGAFVNALAGDVRALWNHNTDIVLGRTGAKTLALSVDAHGLYGEIVINERDSDAMNALARIERGDVSQCSFGFDIIREEMSQTADNVWHSKILEVELYEVSPCTFAAYKDTSISARSDEIRAIQKREIDVWKAKMKGRSKKNGT